MPLMPRQGVSSREGFGPNAPAQLGAGSLPPGMGGMAANPTDPSAQVSMQAQPEITPPTISEAIQQAVEMRQAALQEQQAAQANELLQSDLMEADEFVQQLMGIMGQEATTVDGGAAVPEPFVADEAGAPDQGMSGGGMAEAMMGVGGLGAGPAAAGPAAMGPAGIPPELLREILASQGA